MVEIRRVVVIVLDGVGAGETPDSAEYGDSGSNSLGNTARQVGGLRLPNAGLIFTNLVEFDMTYGHRNDARGYADALESFDAALEKIAASMRPSDIGMIVADHGVDPTTPDTDHSREHIPLLVFGAPVKPNVDLGTRPTYADVAATLAEIFEVRKPRIGTSFLREIIHAI